MVMKRRVAVQSILAVGLSRLAAAAGEKTKVEEFALEFVLASALYGDLPLAEIVPEIARSGAQGLDIWGKPHGTQREELDEIGADAVAALLREHQAKLPAWPIRATAGDADPAAARGRDLGVWRDWTEGSPGRCG
jgi:sugar phosphate isomerase/epimerase